MGELYLVLVKEDDLRLFTSYPQKVKEPIMVESKEEEQDYHGHFYHPYINSGKYREVWKSGNYLLLYSLKKFKVSLCWIKYWLLIIIIIEYGQKSSKRIIACH